MCSFWLEIAIILLLLLPIPNILTAAVFYFIHTVDLLTLLLTIVTPILRFLNFGEFIVSCRKLIRLFGVVSRLVDLGQPKLLFLEVFVREVGLLLFQQAIHSTQIL
jgi:hypothetical protein